MESYNQMLDKRLSSFGEQAIMLLAAALRCGKIWTVLVSCAFGIWPLMSDIWPYKSMSQPLNTLVRTLMENLTADAY